jgi:hypothetical protein
VFGTSSEITRNNPSCFLFLVDQSSSMAEPFGEDRASGVTKAEGVALALNNLLRNLIITCSKSDGIRNYFDVAVIGYGATVGPAWTGALTGQEVVTIRDVANNHARIIERTEAVDDGFGGKDEQTTRFPVWIEPKAKGSTLMCQALNYANNVLSEWVLRNATAFPPVIVHITDGEATDGDPGPLLSALGELGTTNGKVTLFNVHLSSRRAAEPLKFPDSPDALPVVDGKTDPYAKLLFEKASPLTPFMRNVAWENGLYLNERSRAFVLNADPTLLVLALEIGTRPGNVW